MQHQIDNRTLKIVSHYSNLGWPVIPCNGKKPAVKGWPALGVPSEEQIDDWFADPSRNVGLVFGPDTGLIGIDGDGPLARDKLIELLGGPPPETWEFATPHGFRLLYRVRKDKPHPYRSVSLGEGHSELAFLGDGHMSLVPPSQIGGVRYTWIEGRSPDDIEVARAPKAVLRFMNTAKWPVDGERAGDPALEKLAANCPRFQADVEVQRGVGLPEQQWFRWSSLLVASGHPEGAKQFSRLSVKHNQHSEERIADLQVNGPSGKVRCKTLGCAEEQIRKCFGGRVRLDSKGSPTNSPGALLARSRGAKGPQVPLEERARFESMGFSFPDGESRPATLNTIAFARHAAEELDLLYLEPQDRFYRFGDGYWQPLTDNDLKRMLMRMIEPYDLYFWNTEREHEWFEALKRVTQSAGALDSNRQFINLQNGMLDLDSFLLLPHDKSYLSAVRVPIAHDPGAVCPSFAAFLDQVFEGDEGLVDLTQQVFGYCLTSSTKADRAFVLYGSGANGKTTLVEVLSSLVGEENVSHVSLRDLDNAFNRSSIVDKLVNISSENELGTKELNTQYLKLISSGEPIHMERKYHPAFTYRPYCKLVFAMNNLPWSKDKSRGYFRRLMIVPFNRTFSGPERDAGLKDKLLLELPGILNWALEGLRMLRDNDWSLPEPAAVKQASEEYRESISPILQFVRDAVMPGNIQTDFQTYARIIHHYQLWCDNHGLTAGTITLAFHNQIKDALKSEASTTTLTSARPGLGASPGSRSRPVRDHTTSTRRVR